MNGKPVETPNVQTRYKCVPLQIANVIKLPINMPNVLLAIPNALNGPVISKVLKPAIECPKVISNVKISVPPWCLHPSNFTKDGYVIEVVHIDFHKLIHKM